MGSALTVRSLLGVLSLSLSAPVLLSLSVSKEINKLKTMTKIKKYSKATSSVEADLGVSSLK